MAQRTFGVPIRDRSLPVFSLLIAGGMLLTAAAFALFPLRWGAALLAGSALAIALWVQPAVGLILLALAIPFGSLLPLLGVPGNGVDLLVGLTAAAWLARGLVARDVRVVMPWPAWPLLVFVWVAALSLTQANSWSEGIPEWLKWAEVAVLYIVAAQILDRRGARWVIAALLAAGVIQAMIGAAQFWRQIGPEAFALPGRFMRAYGTFRQPNPYAGYLGYLAPVAVSLALLGLGQGIRQRSWRWLAAGLASAGAALAIIAGIGMSWSRGAWIALAAALVVVVGLSFLGLWRRRRTALIMLALLLLAGVLLIVLGAGWLPAGIQARVADLGEYLGGFDPARTEITDANFSVLERVAHWRVGLAMFDDHPWLGIGIGNYAVAYGDYAPPHWYEPLGHAHNIAIHVLAETGFLGAAAFLAFWLALIIYAARMARRGDPFQRALALGLIGAWVYLTIHGMFDNLFVQHMQLQIALLWAALAALAVTTTKRFPERLSVG